MKSMQNTTNTNDKECQYPGLYNDATIIQFNEFRNEMLVLFYA